MGMAGRWRKTMVGDALARQGWRCLYCKCPLSCLTATADHLWPRALRGGDSKDNIAAACFSCNQAKGSLPHVQFFKLIKRDFPRGAPMKIILVWSARRLWKKTHRACERVERSVA